VRWPILGPRYNTRDYPSIAMIIDDIETILETSLQGSLGISRREYKVSFHLGHRYEYILISI
jgi:actin-related protein 8